MTERVAYELDDRVATIRIDDGKANAMSPSLIAEVQAALDRAERDEAIVILTGRPGLFSAGFDLQVFEQGPEPTIAMLRAGARLLERILAFPTPVVAACNGHAVAMGSFLLMCCDYRIGTAGKFKIGMNEVAIGMTLPYFAVELARYRLAPTRFERATVLAELFTPEEAVTTGFLDRVVAADSLMDVARETAGALKKLDMGAYAASKSRTRRDTLDTFRRMADAEFKS
jgi:enoyl-CoA hydratase